MAVGRWPGNYCICVCSGWDIVARSFSRQNVPKRMHILPIQMTTFTPFSFSHVKKSYKTIHLFLLFSPPSLKSEQAFEANQFNVVLSVMSVCFKIQLHPRVLFAALSRGSLRRIQNIRTSFFIGFLHACDILLDVFLHECNRRRSLRQNLKRNLINNQM